MVGLFLKYFVTFNCITGLIAAVSKLLIFSFMAKTISLITTGLQGTLGDITYVKSKRYGKHARTKRGTYKPATLNKKMKESSSRLSFANAPAKLIFDALRHDHKDGSLWSRLLSIYRKQVKDGVAPDIQCLAKLECNHDFKLDVLLSDYKLQTVVDNNMLQVDVQLNHIPVWTKVKYLSGYQVSITALFVDTEKLQLEKVVMHGPVSSMKGDLEPLHFKIPVPAMAKEYLLLMKVEGAENGKLVGLEHVKGMRVVVTAKI